LNLPSLERATQVLALLDLKPSSLRTVLPWHPASRFDAAVVERRGRRATANSILKKSVPSGWRDRAAMTSARFRTACSSSVAALRALQGLLLRRDSVTI
jgi:hypothetical protein